MKNYEKGIIPRVIWGGGSPMDAAKVGSLIAGIDEPIEDLHEYGKTGTKMKECWDCPCHLILVPTTSGTGAETTASGVFSSIIHGLKFSFGNSHISPDLEVIDPELTLGMPAKATIYGGLDTLAHAVEIIVGIASNEYTNMILMFYKDAGLEPLKETLAEQGLAESEKEFTEKMIPLILDDFKSKAWIPPIHTGDYKQKIGKICTMIYEEK